MGTTTRVLQITRHVARRTRQAASLARELARLCCWRDPTPKRVAGALLAAFRGARSAEEQAWIDRIESLRSELSLSTRIVREDRRTGTSMSVGEVCKGASMKPFWAFLQFRLVRALRPASCLELGTALGISGAYQAAALELNGHGRLFTIEGAPAVASVAEENFRKLGLARVSVRVGRFRNVLADVLAECSPLDYAFIDGHHEEEATIRYFRQVLPCLQPEAVLLFHDISWSAGMRRAWRTIRSSKEVRCAVGLPNLGICVVSEGWPGG